MWGQPPRLSGQSEARPTATLTSPPPAHPPKTPPAPASRLPATPPRSSHSIPTHAVCVAQDWPRSPLSARSKFLERRLRRFRRAPAALRCQYQFPAARACLPWELSRRLSPAPRAARSWQSRRSKSYRSRLKLPPLSPQVLPAEYLSAPPPEPPPPAHSSAPLPSSASFQSRSCRPAETQAARHPVSCPRAAVPRTVRRGRAF